MNAPDAPFCRINPLRPEPEIISLAKDLLSHGGLIAYPTTGLYGLGTDALDSRAVQRLFEAKARPRSKPILVLVDEAGQVERLAKNIPHAAERLMDALWPGGLTLVFEASPACPEPLLGGSGKIGVRMAAHPVARALVRALGRPITGTSANLSSQPAPWEATSISKGILSHLDLVLDGGSLSGGPGSTIVDVTCTPIQIIRHGSIEESRVKEAL